MQFGFIGLGQMGHPMATNLSKKHNVLIPDRPSNPSFLKSVNVATETRDFSQCNVLILCLPNGAIVKSVLFGEEGVAKYLKPGAIIVDTSTIEYNATLEIDASLHEMGLKFLDAPISGMRARAEEGTLTMMIGGDETHLDSIKEALSSMASKILHMGPVGSGQLAKLINQLLFDINLAALAEILPFATKLGLDPDKTQEIVNSGTGRSYASEFFIPHILNGDFSNGYPLAAAYKDLISGSEISANQQIPTPVLSAATVTYQQALLQGLGDQDKGAMIQVYERLLGVQFRSRGKKG